MTDVPDPPAPADYNDATDQARWEHQRATDPHYLNIDSLGYSEVCRYLGWHRARIHTINRVLRDLNQPDFQQGLPERRRPTLLAERAHHEQMCERLRAMVPPPQPKKAPTPKRTDDAAAETARIAAHAHRHGLSIRQATADLKGQP